MRISWDGPTTSWHDLVRTIPHATFFHSPTWTKVFEAAEYGHVEVLQADWPDGRMAVLPMAVQPTWRGLSCRASSAIDSGYGGLLANAPLTADELQRLHRIVRRRFPETRFVSNPFDRESQAGIGLPLHAMTPTRVMRLAPLAVLRERYLPDRRRAVRRYENADLATTVIAHPGEADLRLFLDLYHHEVSHWTGTERVRPDAWFRHLWRLAGDQLRLVVATVRGEVAGMEVHVRQGTIATGLFLVWERRFVRCQVPTALVETTLQDCWEQGCRYLDMMTCGDNAGVDQFKASFGAEAVPLSWAYDVAPAVHMLTLAQEAGRRIKALWRLPQSPPSRPGPIGVA